jgi:hypothetical protein
MRIRDPHGQVGTVVQVLDGLDEACQHGFLGPTSAYASVVGDTTEAHAAVSAWLHGLAKPPLTPRSGRWLVVDLDGRGQVLVGALDATYLDN